MKKRTKLIYYLSLFMLIGLALVLIFYGNVPAREKPNPRRISIYIESESYESIGLMGEGAEKAAEILYVDLNIYPISYSVTAQQQKGIVMRELNKDIEAIALPPIDDSFFDLFDNNRKIPVVSTSYKPDYSETVCTISPAYEKISLDIKDLVEEQLPKTTEIIFVASNLDTEKNKRYIKAITSQLEQLEPPPSITQREPSEITDGKHPTDSMVIALDDYALQKTAEAAASGNADNRIIGIGYSVTNIYYLETGIIDALIAEDRYQNGYKMIEAAVNHLDKKATVDFTTPYRMVTQDNIYDADIQTLLFTVR